ncbi:CopG family ribbon-helix-helix protein [Pseudomonas syringae]|uniref:CopG family ribbon-helix-helix protein n=1 Tax=Pseudomonas syringae TaxID=317 RepID=UPI001F0A0C3E|nr:ribbon-helix-helix domain-containing protein [Pseudomonas syringae]
MTGISLNLPEDLSNALADLAKTNGQSISYLAMEVLRDYIEHEKTLIAQIEMAVEEDNQCEFATDEQVAAMRARRGRPWCGGRFNECPVMGTDQIQFS